MAIIGSVFETFKVSNILDLTTDTIDFFMMARGGIEPPTHGFSVRFKLLLLNLIGLYQLLLIVELQ